MLANGATTLWERWEFAKSGEMHSHNHPMLGSIGAWFYSRLAGIRPDEKHPGFHRIKIRPQLPLGMDRLEATYRSCRGPVHVCAWRTADGDVKSRMDLP
jgi:alpha-L-rhamnosidase